jgi:hypothetical protein
LLPLRRPQERANWLARIRADGVTAIRARQVTIDCYYRNENSQLRRIPEN